MFFTKLRNLFINQETVKGIKEVADTAEKEDKDSNIFSKSSTFIPYDTEPDDSLPENVYQEVADELGTEVAMLKAFVKVESGGINDLEGKVVIRWETRIFRKYTGIIINVHGQRGIVNTICQKNEWEALNRAAYKLENGKYEREAFMSMSAGAMQIMGFHYSKLGYDSPKDMIDYIFGGIDNSIRLVGKFIKNKTKLHKAIINLDFPKIAYYYNGKNYHINEYDVKMKIWYNKYKES